MEVKKFKYTNMKADTKLLNYYKAIQLLPNFSSRGLRPALKTYCNFAESWCTIVWHFKCNEPGCTSAYICYTINILCEGVCKMDLMLKMNEASTETCSEDILELRGILVYCSVALLM